MAHSPPILLISLDATRFDYMVDEAGNWRWPFFKHFAEKAHIFQNAYTPSPWTPPAHASMFTGLSPSEHGVVEGQLWLKNHHQTLARFLNKKGYRTIGISSNPLLGPITNLNKDFDTFYELWKNPKRVQEAAQFLRFDDIILDSHDVLQKAIDILSNELSTGSAKPIFLFLQLIGPHNPYRPTATALANQVGLYTDEVWDRVKRINQDWRYFYAEGWVLSDTETSLLRQLYLAELDDLNAGLERLFTLPWVERAAQEGHIIITADHGEMLGEKGHIHHLFNLYEPLIHIPLLWKTPGQSKAVSHEEFIQHQHLFPLIRRLLAGETEALSEWQFSAPEFATASLLNPVEILQGLDGIDDTAGDPFRHDQIARVGNDRKVIWHSNGHHECFDFSVNHQEVENQFSLNGTNDAELLDGCEREFRQFNQNTVQVEKMMFNLGYF